jgi:hypothetical protein
VTTQKARERWLLEQFLAVSKIRTVIVEREAPDFEIEVEARRIGVEVTELFHSPQPGQLPLQAASSISAEIVQRAQRLHAAIGGPSLRVSVAFSDRRGLGSIRRDQAAQALLDIVHETLLQPGTALDWRPRYKEDLKRAEVFSHVHIYRQPPTIQPHWLVVAAGWVAPLTAELVQSRIDQKALRMAQYQSALPEIWLLIGVLGRDPSQFFEVDSSQPNVTMNSPFHRTYYLDLFRGVALELHAPRAA